MRRSLRSGVLAAALAGVAVGCSNSSTTTTPTTPTVVATTESFSGTLTLNSGVTFTFASTAAGAANLTLTSLDPDLTVQLDPGGQGAYTVGEIAYQGASVDAATGKGTVFAWLPATRQLLLKDISGSFAAGTAMVGADSGARWAETSIDTPVVGIALGTTSGTTCSLVLTNDIAGPGSIVTGAVTGAGALCARVYDVGKTPIASPFTVSVTHY